MVDIAEFCKAVKESNADNHRSLENKFKKRTFQKETVPNLTAEDWPACEELIVALLEKAHVWMVRDYLCPLMDKKKIVDWKARTDFIDRLFETFWNTVFLKDGFDRHYSDFFESLHKILKTNRLLPQYHGKILEIIERALAEYGDDTDHAVLGAGRFVAEYYPWKTDREAAVRVMKAMKEAVRAHGEIGTSQELLFNVYITMLQIFRALNGTPYVTCILDEITEIVHICKDQEWDEEGGNDKKTMAHRVLTTIMEDYLNRHDHLVEVLKPNMAAIRELWQCGEETLERDANNIISKVAGNVELMGDNVDETIERYLSGEDPDLISSFLTLYNDCPENFESRLDEFVEIMLVQDDLKAMSSVSLLWEMAKKDVSLFRQSHLDAIVEQTKKEYTVHTALFLIQCLADRRPHDMLQYDDVIISTMERLGQNGFQGAAILVALSECGEEHVRKYLKYLVSKVPSAESNYQIGLLYNIRSIGLQCLPALDPYKDVFIDLKKEAPLADSCQALLDVMEGRTLQSISKNVDDQRQDIDELDERVTTTEDNVENVTRDVDRTKKDIRNIQEDVTKVEGRVDELEEVVDETVEKVEEIDRKTLSHAPAWSRDVSLLMNPEREHDWRLLASRLGYTAEDVRNWATQPDPCLSLLDEWFATHKTREATYAVLKGLQEMNRMDAAAIVEKALEDVEDVIDEEPEELLEPPPVFISYQWGLQPEAKLLKRHLEMAGFKAWMDIGQMGGGDKLFAKIDQGIRAAKVVICCVSTKYAESPNCNREVNLSVTLGKPIIPLLMENLSWPPPGAMGPIFGEYLFIRFFARKGEESGDERYWPVPKFQELLMQLRYSIVPEDQLITEEYKGWWDPPEDVIVIKPKDEKKEQKAVGGQSENEEVKPSSPDIFISYQWGKQPQIKKLYGRLTSLGLSCWLDIMQMGGGDSLYDKIDKGVRGCKVVLTCVTTKYSISANCRREVSLADALKKPIVPLLLEKMAWPPEGPMGMVLTQLLYINFCKPDADIQNHWECPQLEELLGQIRLNGVSTAGLELQIEKGEEGDEENHQTVEEGDGTDQHQTDDDENETNAEENQTEDEEENETNERDEEHQSEDEDENETKEDEEHQTEDEEDNETKEEEEKHQTEDDENETKEEDEEHQTEDDENETADEEENDTKEEEHKTEDEEQHQPDEDEDEQKQIQEGTQEGAPAEVARANSPTSMDVFVPEKKPISANASTPMTVPLTPAKSSCCAIV